MKRAIVKRLAGAVGALLVIFGCNTALNQGGGGSSGGGGSGTTGFAESNGRFTDAPQSPGGTGGVIGDDIAGTDDVDLQAEETRSFFTAFQIDPVQEDTAGPKFVVAGDVDQDGWTDLVSAWNQSQPIQLHLQRRDPAGTISFRTITLAGTTPVAVVAGLKLGQINGDGWLDVVILVKATGFGTLCPTSPPTEISKLEGEIVVLFSPGSAALIPDGDLWREMTLVNPYVQDRWIHNQFPGIEFKDFEESKTKPEWSGFTSLLVADIDGQPGDDIVVALNPGSCKELGQEPPTNTVDLWVNPGPALAEDSASWGAPPPPGLSRGVPVTLMSDGPQVKDLAAMDIDDDGDLDVIATWTNAISQNIAWVRNPMAPHNPGGPSGLAAVISGTEDGVDFCIGGLNDEGQCVSDADCTGTADGTCAGGVCVGGPVNGATCADNGTCAGIPDGFCSPGRWHTFADEWQRRPIGQLDTGADMMAIGDIDGDGSADVVVRSTDGGIVQWFRRPNALVVPPEFPPPDAVPDRFNFPWPVFTLTEIGVQEPAAISVGDLTGNGRLELVAAVQGGVFWYDGSVAASVFDPWTPNPIIQDSPVQPSGSQGSAGTGGVGAGGSVGGAAPGTGVGVSQVDTSTYINALLVVDLDGDGRNDILGTLDRRSGTGLSDDRLVWYRNTRTEAPAP